MVMGSSLDVVELRFESLVRKTHLISEIGLASRDSEFEND